MSDWNQRSVRPLDLCFETEDRAATRQRLTEGAIIIGQWSTVGSTQTPGAGPVGDAGCRAAPPQIDRRLVLVCNQALRIGGEHRSGERFYQMGQVTFRLFVFGDIPGDLGCPDDTAPAVLDRRDRQRNVDE